MSRREIIWKLRDHLESLLTSLGLSLPGKVMYIGGSDTLPAPLEREAEAELIARLERGDRGARDLLIEHNLRLVAYIARRFENTGINIEDLDSLGYSIIHIDEIPHTGADKLQNFQFGQSVDHLMSELRNGKGNNLRITRARYNLVYALGHTAEDADLAVLLQWLKKFRLFNELTCIQHTNNHSE